MPKQSSDFLGDLLPLKFEGGLKLDAIEEGCDKCGYVIPVDCWSAGHSYLHHLTCVINLNSSCPKCNSAQKRAIRIRAQKAGWVAIDRQVNGVWKTAVIGNIQWKTLLHRKILALPIVQKVA